jgi:hypothetical protein
MTDRITTNASGSTIFVGTGIEAFRLLVSD